MDQPSKILVTFFILGTVLYNRYLSTWSYRGIWFTTQVLLVLVNLLDLVRAVTDLWVLACLVERYTSNKVTQNKPQGVWCFGGGWGVGQVWVRRWNKGMGMSDKFFILGEEVIAPLVSRFNTMPMFILAAKLCPDGVEATLFAMNMGLSNMGVVMGSYVGIGLLAVLGGVEAPEFKR